MPFFLSNRDTKSRERMDDPNCDPVELENTYRQFRVINSLISRWRHIYKQLLRPELENTGGSGTLLDIGFGGGDIPLKLARWASEDNLDLHITAIDDDPRACRFIGKRETVPAQIQFRHASSTDLIGENKSFDFVISNHLLHHIEEARLQNLLNEARLLSRNMVIFNDIRRTDTGYLLFNILSRPVFRSSFITEDGLTSIRRSYTAGELNKATPDNWEVRRLFPFRLLLMFHHDQQKPE